jgi:hypothetical protein
MASLTPLKELINNSSLGDMDKILARDPFPLVKLGKTPINILNKGVLKAQIKYF